MNPLKSFIDQAKKSARKITKSIDTLVKDGMTGRDVVEKLRSRLNLWQNVGKQIFGKGQVDEPQIKGLPEKRYRWQLGATEEHCTDCLALSGVILTVSEWKSISISPQSRDLECGGWNCDCQLIETEQESIGIENVNFKRHVHA